MKLRALAAVVVLAACGSSDPGPGEVADDVAAALAAAGIAAEDVQVEGDEPTEGSWRVGATVGGDAIVLRVAADSGRIDSMDVGDAAVDRAQLEALAVAVAEDRADPARGWMAAGVGIVVATIGIGLGVARRLRLREESGAPEAQPES